MAIVFPSIDMLPPAYFKQTPSRPYPIFIGQNIIYRSAFWQIGNNAKLSINVPNCSMPLETCACQGLNCLGCYARRLHGLRPSMRYHSLTNYFACLYSPEKVIEESKAFLAGFERARFNVSGEITPLIAPVYDAIAKACPNTQFLLFTKSIFSERLTAPNIIIKKSEGINYAKNLAIVHDMAEKAGGFVCMQQVRQNKHICGGICRTCWLTGRVPVFFFQH